MNAQAAGRGWRADSQHHWRDPRSHPLAASGDEAGLGLCQGSAGKGHSKYYVCLLCRHAADTIQSTGFFAHRGCCRFLLMPSICHLGVEVCRTVGPVRVPQKFRRQTTSSSMNSSLSCYQGLYLESQVAQNDRRLYPKLARH